MKLNTFGLTALLSLSTLLSHATYAGDTVMTYKNTRGSTLVLHFTSSDTLTGTFTTAVASKDCQSAIGTERPIVGYVTNSAIAFSVDYPDCGSVVTFTGNIQKDNRLIDTTAIVAHPSVDISKEGPGARFISHDVFTVVD